MPFFEGSEPLENYLKGLGINYIIHSDFNAPGQFISGVYAEYSKPFWMGMSHSPFEIWRVHAPYFLDMMDNIESLEKDHGAIRASNLTLISLQIKSDQAEK
jgi:hypothetical protein